MGLGARLAPAKTEHVLLLDADIELDPHMVGQLKQKLINEQLDFVSIMARLRMESFWEKLLAPAFIYFFKVLYPFSSGTTRNPDLAWPPAVVSSFARMLCEKQGPFYRSETH